MDGQIDCQPDIPPGNELCDGQDNDCDGWIDEGVLNACGRCGPVPQEICNGVDDDCDGGTDEGTPCPLPQGCVDGICTAPCDGPGLPGGLHLQGRLLPGAVPGCPLPRGYRV